MEKGEKKTTSSGEKTSSSAAGQTLRSGSLIRQNGQIKQAIISELAARRLTASDVVKDAHAWGMTQVTNSSLSKYLSSTGSIKQGSLTEEAIFFLCIRYNIDLKLTVSKGKWTMNQRLEEMLRFFPKVYKAWKKDNKAILDHVFYAQQREEMVKNYG